MGWHFPLLLATLGAASLSYAFARETAGRTRAVHVVALALTLLWYSSPWSHRATVSEPWHMANHLIVAMVVAPVTLTLWDLYHRDNPTSTTKRWANPVVTFLLLATVTPFFHLTSWGVALMAHPWMNSIEMLSFYVVGLAYFRPLLSASPSIRIQRPADRFAYLASVIPVFTVTGLLMAYSRHAPHMAGMVNSATQNFRAGLTMWLLGSGFLTLYASVVAIQWMRGFFASRRSRLV
jgi:cytochrome c oxidase assembly factor CtaG